MDQKTVSITGMACSGCERAVESALDRLAGVNRTDADHEHDAVTVVVVASEDVTDDDFVTAIRDAGYDVRE